MGGLWSITRHTVVQCIRTRSVVMFLLLLAVMLAAMPFVLTGDDTLAGRIRTFLSYSTALTATALSVLTVFFTVAAVSEDVRTRMIFSVAVKPVARWQYMLGRWLGVVMLTTLLLVTASTGIYAMAMYLRTGALAEAINARDRATVETEVFTARKRVSPVSRDIDVQTIQRIRSMQETGQYNDALDDFARRFGEDLAEQELYNEIHKQIAQRQQSVKPMEIIGWRFVGVNVAGTEFHSSGRVARVRPDDRLMQIQADGDVIGRLVFRGPVRVNGMEAWVAQLNKDSFDVLFQAEEFSSYEVSSIDAGDEVELTIEPTIQITYKASASSYPPDGRLRSLWIVASPSGDRNILERNDPVRQPATLTISARVVGLAVDLDKWIALRTEQIAREEGLDEDQARSQALLETPPLPADAPRSVVTWMTDVRYLNQLHPLTGQGTSVTILDEDISVMFRVGSFEANFVRGVLLTMIQLAYIAALGALAGSFLVFPVGCLLVFSLLPFSLFREYLTEAVKMTRSGQLEWYIWPGRVLVHSLAGLLPDLESASAGRWLVDGMYIPWSFVGEVALWTFVVRTVFVLALACLIFRSRELARVQV